MGTWADENVHSLCTGGCDRQNPLWPNLPVIQEKPKPGFCVTWPGFLMLNDWNLYGHKKSDLAHRPLVCGHSLSYISGSPSSKPPGPTALARVLPLLPTTFFPGLTPPPCRHISSQKQKLEGGISFPVRLIPFTKTVNPRKGICLEAEKGKGEIPGEKNIDEYLKNFILPHIQTKHI